MQSVKYFNWLKLFLLKVFLAGMFINGILIYAQKYQLKRDSILIKNFQIEFIGDKNFLFVSNDGIIEFDLFNINDFTRVNVIDIDTGETHNLYADELKISNEIISFSTGTVIEAVTFGRKKTFEIGIDATNGLKTLYTIPDRAMIVEIPIQKKFTNKKIHKIRYRFSGGYNSLYKVKLKIENIRIIPIIYTCNSVDCAQKKNLISSTEVNFPRKSKYFDIDLRQYDLTIDEKTKYLYVGYITLDYFVIKEKNVEKIGENKCYYTNSELDYFKISENSCPVISLIIE